MYADYLVFFFQQSWLASCACFKGPNACCVSRDQLLLLRNVPECQPWWRWKVFFFFFNGWEEFFAHLTRSGLYVAVIEHIIIIILFPGNIIKKSPNRGMENDPIQNSLVNHQREAFPVNSITGDLVYHHAYLFPQGILQFPAR